MLGRSPPRGALRLLARIPIWLYRARLGWLLGSRFLLVVHRGRQSGLRRMTVLEVIGSERRRTYYVAAPWGARSDWFRNLQVQPRVTIDVGARRYQAKAEFLVPQESERLLRAYAGSHRRAAGALSRLLDYRDWEELSRMVRVVAFRVDAGSSAAD